MEISLEQRRVLAQLSVTLDGRPARIVGVRREYAVVTSLDGRASAEWSWRAAARICDAGGQFRT